ncbi:MAG TPA: hypothetical protein VK507_04205 [Iamia sp.]|nr:hypothetical protein [Iamia sp.]
MRRLAGSCWRAVLWVIFPPLGWYRSRQATHRRRHRETIAALRQNPPGGPRPCRHC